MIIENRKNITNKPIIYSFRHKDNNKLYFGETKNGYSRINKGHRDETMYIDLAIQKHSWEKFEIEVLHEFDYLDKEELLWIEANYIECFQTYLKKNGYNISRYGSFNKGKISLKTRKKMSESWKEKYKNGYINNSKGKTASPETKLKMSKSHTGKKLSKKHKEILRKYNVGRHHSQQMREKLRKFRTGKKASKETRLKMSKLNVGKNNPKYDNLIYKFKNVITNEVFNGTKYDFYKKYNLTQSHIYHLVNNKRKSHKNWILLK